MKLHFIPSSQNFIDHIFAKRYHTTLYENFLFFDSLEWIIITQSYNPICTWSLCSTIRTTKTVFAVPYSYFFLTRENHMGYKILSQSFNKLAINLVLVDLFQKVHCVGLVTPTILWYFKVFEFSRSKFTASKQAVSRSNESCTIYLLK